MKTTITLSTLALLAGYTTACTTVPSNTVTFYGYPDNSPPGASVAHDCGGRDYLAGGTGTYADPVTFATAPGEYSVCEILYLPLLKKYVRYEDDCEQCITDFKSGKKHIDIWTGSSTSNGGNSQIQCEDNLTSGGTYTVVRTPGQGYEVDTTPLFEDGKCNTGNVFESNKATCDTGSTPSSSSGAASSSTTDAPAAASSMTTVTTTKKHHKSKTSATATASPTQVAATSDGLGHGGQDGTDEACDSD